MIAIAGDIALQQALINMGYKIGEVTLPSTKSYVPDIIPETADVEPISMSQENAPDISKQDSDEQHRNITLVAPTIFQCQLCGKAFSSKQNLVHHNDQHLGVLYCCDFKGKAYYRKEFENKRSYDRHSKCKISL